MTLHCLRTVHRSTSSLARQFANTAVPSIGFARPLSTSTSRSPIAFARKDTGFKPFSTPRLGRTMSSSAPADKKDNGDVTKWASKDGQFHRQVSSFRDEIKKGGKFEPELNRYILICAYACPWAHRAMIVRKLKGIDKVEGLLPFYSVDSFLGKEGWSFVPYEEPAGFGVPGTGLVPGHEDKKRLRDFYFKAEPDYDARFTVPIIWDNKLQTIVNNESSEVIRNLNFCFDDFLPEDKKGVTYYPEDLREEIDGVNDWIYNTINNGVYKCGFATTQEAYESNVGPLFESLDRVEKILSDGRKYLTGDRLTEADIRLWTTIIRFDPVYVGHFKTNTAMIRSGYPRIHAWCQQLYFEDEGKDAFESTTDFDSIKAHYYQSHSQINPTRIVPKGPYPHILPPGQTCARVEETGEKRKKL